jgi:hypothetical protein
MIIELHTEPPHILEYDASAYSKYTASVDPAATLEDYYKFITAPSPQRARFTHTLSSTTYKADSQSVIEHLHY